MPRLIYNVTIKISPEVHDEWVEWMRVEHIPDVMTTSCFSSYRFLHLEGYDDEEGITYAIQYYCPNEMLYEIYKNEYAPVMQAKHKERFGGKFVAFRTILSVIEEG